MVTRRRWRCSERWGEHCLVEGRSTLQEWCSMPSMVEVPCQDSTGGSKGKLLKAPIQRKTEEKEAVDSALSRTQAHKMMRRTMVVGCLGKNGCRKTLRKTRTTGLNPHLEGRRGPRRGRCRSCHHRGGPSRKYGEG